MSSRSLITPVVQRWLDNARTNPEAFWERAARAAARGSARGTRPRVDAADVPLVRRRARRTSAYNALDHHVANGRGGHAALMYFNERGERARLHLRASCCMR